MGIVLGNNAHTLLSANISSTDTTIYVSDVSSFPTLGVGDYFYCTIESTTGTYEIVKVTQINAASFDVVRGQESTIAVPFNIGARVELRVTVANLEDFINSEIDAVDPLVDADIGVSVQAYNANLTEWATTNPGAQILPLLTGTMQEFADDLLITASGAAVARSLTSHVSNVIYAADYGVGDSTTTEYTSELQAAIDAASVQGGGRVKLRAGRIVINATITLPSKVVLSGEGCAVTELYLANSSNCVMVESEDFATLSGTDAWLVADGVPHGSGFEHIRLHGNKDNQSSGAAVVRFYVKRPYIHDLMIVQGYGTGFHSEANYSIPGAPAENGDDFPEGIIDGLYIWECADGMVWRGQHDTSLDNIFIGVCSGWGLKTQTSDASNYNGSADWGLVHIYACTSGGAWLDCPGRYQHLICESNFGQGLLIDEPSVHISFAQLYNNCRTTGTYQATIAANANYCVIGQLQLEDDGQNKSGLQVLADLCQVDLIDLKGESSTGTALEVSGYSNRIAGNINGYSGVGGVGMLTGNAEQMVACVIDVNITDCKTLWNNASAGSLNQIRVTGLSGASQTATTGTVVQANETWIVRIYDTDTAKNLSYTCIGFANTGLRLADTDNSHDLTIAPGSNLSAARTFTLTTGDADRTLTLGANVSLNQNLQTTDSPTFANPLVTTLELGNSDTTLSRSAAGILAVEGVDVVLTSGAQTINGAKTFGSSILAPLGSLSSVAYGFTGDPNTGMYSPGADQCDLVTNGSARLRVNNTQIRFVQNLMPDSAAGASIGISSLPFGPIYFRPGASVTPANNGDVVFEATSNTSFTIKHKGSDGTVRSVVLTLA